MHVSFLSHRGVFVESSGCTKEFTCCIPYMHKFLGISRHTCLLPRQEEYLMLITSEFLTFSDIVVPSTRYVKGEVPKKESQLDVDWRTT